MLEKRIIFVCKKLRKKLNNKDDDEKRNSFKNIHKKNHSLFVVILRLFSFWFQCYLPSSLINQFQSSFSIRLLWCRRLAIKKKFCYSLKKIDFFSSSRCIAAVSQRCLNDLSTHKIVDPILMSKVITQLAKNFKFNSISLPPSTPWIKYNKKKPQKEIFIIFREFSISPFNYATKIQSSH